MKKYLLIVSAFYLLFLFGCGTVVNPGNLPQKPDGPLPSPHDGVFTTENGEFVFNGDGKSIKVAVYGNLAELFELDEGEYEGKYTFLSGNLPPNGSFSIRYDAAHELEIELDDHGKEYKKIFDIGIASDDGKSSTVSLYMVSEDRIPLLFDLGGFYTNVIFEKE